MHPSGYCLNCEVSWLADKLLQATFFLHKRVTFEDEPLHNSVSSQGPLCFRDSQP